MAIGDSAEKAIQHGIDEWVSGVYWALHDALAHQGPEPSCFWPETNEPAWAVFATGVGQGSSEADANAVAIDTAKLRGILARGIADDLDRRFSHRLRMFLSLAGGELTAAAYLDERWEPRVVEWLKGQDWPKVQYGRTRACVVFRPVARAAPGPVVPHGSDLASFRRALAATDHRLASSYLIRAMELEPSNPELPAAIEEYLAIGPKTEATPSVEGAAYSTLVLEAKRSIRRDNAG